MTIELQQLQLRNIGQHEKLDLQLRPGINCVLGANGSGKSTILDAVRFLFTNEFDAPGNKGDNVRHGQKSGKVSGVFRANEAEYQLTRNVGTAGQRLIGPQVDERSVAAVDQQLTELAGANTQTLLNNVFVGQGKIDRVLFQKESERLKEFQNTFGLERAAQSVKHLGSEISRYNISHGLEEELQQKQQALAAAEARAREFQQREQQLRQQIQQLEPLRQQLQEEIRQRNLIATVAQHREDLQKVEQELQQLGETSDGLADQIRQLEQQLALQTDQQLQEERDRLLQHLQSLRELQQLPQPSAESEAQARQLAEVRQQIPPLEERVERINGYFVNPEERPPYPPEVEAQQQLQQLEPQCSEMRQLLEARQQQLEQQRREVQQLSAAAAESACPTCGRPYDEGSHEEAQQRHQQAEQQLQQAEQQFQQLEAEAQPLFQQLTEQQQLVETRRREGLNLLQQALDETKRQLREQQQLQQQLQQRLETEQQALARRQQLEKILEAFPKSADPEKQFQKLNDDIQRRQQLRQELTAVTERLSSTDDQIGRQNQRRDQLQQLLEQASSARTTMTEQQLQQLTDELRGWDQLHDQLSDAVREIRSSETEVQGLGQSIQLLQQRLKKEEQDRQWVGVCRRAQDVLRPSKLPTLLMMEYARLVNSRIDFYLQLWQSPFTLRIEPEQGFAFIANKDGHDMNAARLSGGEKIVASTSFRLAMADTFASEVGLLVLDEPSAYLDQDNIHHLQDLLVHLKELTSSSGRQILLVTHEPSLLGFVDHSITI